MTWPLYVQNTYRYSLIHIGSLFKLLAEGSVSGLRIDHPDGLWNPERYFLRLQKGYIDAFINHTFPEQPSMARQLAEQLNERLESKEAVSKWPLYVVGEKIPFGF